MYHFDCYLLLLLHKVENRYQRKSLYHNDLPVVVPV